MTTFIFGRNYNVVLAAIKQRYFLVELQRSFSNNTSQLQRHFSNNITTLCRRLLIDVFFATLLQSRDMVERRRDFKTTTLQRCHNVACLLGNSDANLKR